MTADHRSPELVPEVLQPALRAALYMRVSTGRQAEHDLSIPDQRSQLKSWCRANGHTVIAEFVEAGASAGDDRRPAFQQMIERACDGEHGFDITRPRDEVVAFALNLDNARKWIANLISMKWITPPPLWLSDKDQEIGFGFVLPKNWKLIVQGS